MSPNEIIYALESGTKRIAELNALLKADRSELARLRAEVERLRIGGEQTVIEKDDAQRALVNARARAERAEAERDALAKDKARLDWLEKNWINWPIPQNEETIRAAIDAAMKP